MSVLKDTLARERTVCRAPVVSKKRLFESIASVISDDQSSLPYDEILAKLTEREKLGSTGLGQGIAIPHCRAGNCNQPLGTLVTLETPIDFDAPDEKPVDLLFVLLVPEEADQQHLDLLAAIVRLFSQAGFCDQLRSCDSDDALFELATRQTVETGH